MSKKSVITLGMSPDLSLAELESAYFSSHNTSWQRLNNFQIITQYSDGIEKLPHILGGVVKVGEYFEYPDADDKDDAAEIIVKLVIKLQLKTNLAYSSFSHQSNQLQRMGQQVKNKLKSKNIKSRYRILANLMESAGIGSKFDEIQLLKVDQGIGIGVTRAVQDIDLWNKKDYGRPRVDARSGMMPPKVARMMVNLALPEKYNKNTWMYDPMCGTGTLINEALDLGVSALGSDNSQRAVDDASENASWFTEKFEPMGKFIILQADATQLDPDKISEQVSGVMFEGYLGPANLRYEKILDMTKGMIKMYRGIFKRLSNIQPEDTKLVCALPEFELDKSVKMFDNLVDSCEKYGYTLLSKPLTYGRDGARVKRRIYQLRKQ